MCCLKVSVTIFQAPDMQNVAVEADASKLLSAIPLEGSAQVGYAETQKLVTAKYNLIYLREIVKKSNV